MRGFRHFDMVLRGPSLKPLPGLYRRRATPPVQLADTFERPNTSSIGPTAKACGCASGTSNRLRDSTATWVDAHCPHYGSAARLKVVRGARLFLTYLRDARIITLPSVEPPVQEPALLSVFCQWMRQQRGTGDVTLRTYGIYIHELLQRFGEKSSRFDARRLRAFVLAKSRSCGWGAVKNCAKALRMFLRFLIAEGQCAVGLDAAIPTVAHWRLASLPRYLQPEDVERLIASCDRASAVGRRDRSSRHLRGSALSSDAPRRESQFFPKDENPCPSLGKS